MMQTDKEYAEALFMLAAEEQSTESYSEALAVICRLVTENPEYMEFLASPAISLEERLQAVDEAFGSMPEHIVSFIKLLCENRRIRTLSSCIEEYNKLAMALSNKTVANVYSAVELSTEQKQAICMKLEKLTGKIIEPVYTIDESLIGGVKIDVEGKTYDGSIRNRLKDVKDVILG